MTAPTLLAIDQGTTSTRAMLLSVDGEILASAQTELPQLYPHKGWVEQDPMVIWRDTLDVCRQVVATGDAAQTCVAIGIANQRETTIVWDRATGQPVYNAIVWQDRRTAAHCDALIARGLGDMVTKKTGLRIDPYFSCTKIQWLLDTVPDCRARAERGELAFGTIDSFLLWHLTGGVSHATDATNASRTGLFNIVTQQWDDDLLTLYDVPRSLLPEVKDNVALFGYTDPTLFGKAIPIGGMAGDQQAALIGQGCVTPGLMKSTYGTGCFALLNIGSVARLSQHNLLTTTAYRLQGQTTYAIEGSIFTAGSAVTWLRDKLGLITHAADSEATALSVPDNNGVYFIPAFTGLGAPHWQPLARAMICGLTSDSDKAHMVRAALEAQAYQTRDLLLAMAADSGVHPAALRIDGGLAANRFVCQFLADILHIPIELPRITETTALGAAYLAGLYAGVYDSLDTITHHWQAATVYQPHMASADADRLYQGWTDNLTRLLPS